MGQKSDRHAFVMRICADGRNKVCLKRRAILRVCAFPGYLH